MARVINEESILNGPGKFDLMLSLFEGKELTFRIEGGQILTARISSVQREDGSNNSWNLTGQVNGEDFSAYYSTSRKKGFAKYYTSW